jgi:hypothetical protein
VKVKANGSRLKLLLKLWNDKKLASMSKWSGSFWRFPSHGDDFLSPGDVNEELIEADSAIAILQTIQAQYNLKVMINVGGTESSLLQAVKQIGGAGRSEKRWAEASRNDNDSTRRMRRWEVEQHNAPRDTDKEYPVPTMEADTIAEYSLGATKHAAQLREGIAKGNGTMLEIEIPDGLLIDDQ